MLDKNPHDMEYYEILFSVPQHDVVLPSSDNCLRKLEQLEFYVTNDVDRKIPGNAGSLHGAVDQRLAKQSANFCLAKKVKKQRVTGYAYMLRDRSKAMTSEAYWTFLFNRC